MSRLVYPSQVFCETDDDEQDEVDVVDEEEKKDEIMVNQMVNNETVDHQQEPLPVSHVSCPPQHMANLNLGAVEPSSNIFHNPYVQTQLNNLVTIT